MGLFFFPLIYVPLIYVVPNLSHINSIHSILNQPAVLDSVKQISLGGLHKLGDSHRSVRWMSSFVILIHELEIPLTRQKLNQPWHLGSSSLNTAHYSTECGWLRWWVLVLMQGRTLRSRLAWTVVQGKDGLGQLVHALRAYGSPKRWRRVFPRCFFDCVFVRTSRFPSRLLFGGCYAWGVEFQANNLSQLFFLFIVWLLE